MEYNAQKFFNSTAEFYGNAYPTQYNYYIIDFINSTRGDRALRLLDIGGASGVFGKLVVEKCSNIKVTVIDPSEKLLEKIDCKDIEKIVGMLPDKINTGSTYDYIQVKEVFHHLVGATVRESRDSMKESLLNIRDMLNDDGFLIVHEIFYESHITPSLSSHMIFHLCSMQIKYGFNIPIKEFLPGLKVFFYTREDLRKALKETGYEIIDYYEDKYPDTIKKSLLLLRDWGNMIFICRKAKDTGHKR